MKSLKAWRESYETKDVPKSCAPKKGETFTLKFDQSDLNPTKPKQRTEGKSSENNLKLLP